MLETFPFVFLTLRVLYREGERKKEGERGGEYEPDDELDEHVSAGQVWPCERAWTLQRVNSVLHAPAFTDGQTQLLPLDA